jgi:hypothetical protein
MQKIILFLFLASCQIEFDYTSRKDFCENLSCDGTVNKNKIYCKEQIKDVPNICSCFQNQEKVICYDK